VEYYALAKDVGVQGRLGQGTCATWGEPLEVTAGDAEVLLSFDASNAWLSGKPAMVTRRFGKGRITYLGAWLDARLMESVLSWAMEAAGVAGPSISTPAGVSLHEMRDGDEPAWILNNCTPEAKTIEVPGRMKDEVSGQVVSGQMTLEPRGVALLRRAPPVA
jgi:beta-galactosidase